MRPALIAVLLCTCSSGTPEDCGTLASVARTQVKLRVSTYASPCANDSECTLVDASLTCYVGCPSAISAQSKVAFGSALDTLSSTLCAGTTCTVNEGCGPPVRAQCSGGRCRTVEGVADAGVPPDAGASDGG